MISLREDVDDAARVGEFAFQYRHALVRTLMRMDGFGGAIWGGEQADTNLCLSMALVVGTARLVLWRTDICQCALNQGDQFTGTIIPPDLWPSKSQLWTFYGAGAARMRHLNSELWLGAAFLSVSDTMIGVTLLYYPIKDGMVDMNARPSLEVCEPIKRGQPVGRDAGHVLSMLSFMNSTVASVEKVNLPRPIRRRLERVEKKSPPALHVVQLRRKERAPREDAHMTEREYQCQWLVQAHVRRLSAGTEEERLVWVRSYVKGPTDKPLKPPTPTVIVVGR